MLCESAGSSRGVRGWHLRQPPRRCRCCDTGGLRRRRRRHVHMQLIDALRRPGTSPLASCTATSRWPGRQVIQSNATGVVTSAAGLVTAAGATHSRSACAASFKGRHDVDRWCSSTREQKIRLERCVRSRRRRLGNPPCRTANSSRPRRHGLPCHGDQVHLGYAGA